ncbi:hypothetical protein Tco_0003366 [Tanacetum coccineum]
MSGNDNFSLHDDEELSLHDDASLDGSVPASNKGDAPAKPPQIITTNTLSNIKLPVLQKDDYDTWAMEMEHYLEYIDNEVWKVIQNGNSKKRVTKGKDGVYRVLPPTTQEEQFADEKERKARTLLLMAVPKDHLRRFHGMDDAKEIWAAIKTRFEGLVICDKKLNVLFTEKDVFCGCPLTSKMPDEIRDTLVYLAKASSNEANCAQEDFAARSQSILLAITVQQGKVQKEVIDIDVLKLWRMQTSWNVLDALALTALRTQYLLQYQPMLILKKRSSLMQMMMRCLNKDYDKSSEDSQCYLKSILGRLAYYSTDLFRLELSQEITDGSCLKNVSEALEDGTSWVEAMQEERLAFSFNSIGFWCDLPNGDMVDRVLMGFYRNKEGCAGSSCQNQSLVYQLDVVKSVFSIMAIDEEVYCLPPLVLLSCTSKSMSLSPVFRNSKDFTHFYASLRDLQISQGATQLGIIGILGFTVLWKHFLCNARNRLFSHFHNEANSVAGVKLCGQVSVVGLKSNVGTMVFNVMDTKIHMISKALCFVRSLSNHSKNTNTLRLSLSSSVNVIERKLIKIVVLVLTNFAGRLGVLKESDVSRTAWAGKE